MLYVFDRETVAYEVPLVTREILVFPELVERLVLPVRQELTVNRAIKDPRDLPAQRDRRERGDLVVNPECKVKGERVDFRVHLERLETTEILVCLDHPVYQDQRVHLETL